MLKRNPIIYCFAILILFGCKPGKVTIRQEIAKDNKYDSEFPNKSVSSNLSYISKTVKKLDVLAFYANYYFPPESNVYRSNLSDSILNIYSDNMEITNESVLGTVSVIYNSNNLIGLLTCAHIVDFEDSIFTFIGEENQIQTVSIKIKQQNHVSGFASGDPIEIVALNKEKDIALLMKKTDSDNQNIQTLDYPVGKAKDLQWGTVVYIMGYPLGTLMVTRAIASMTSKQKIGQFVTDALYNRGISGSPIFALRDGVPNFELVGIASSSAAQESDILVPDQIQKTDGTLKTPYEGDVFVDNNKLISYGVTYSVTIDEIITFISINEKALIFNGFDMNYFFK